MDILNCEDKIWVTVSLPNMVNRTPGILLVENPAMAGKVSCDLQTMRPHLIKLIGNGETTNILAHPMT